MHVLTMGGQLVEYRAQAIGLTRNVPELCALTYVSGFESVDEEETERFVGELLKARPGRYVFGWSLLSEALIISETKFILGATLLHERTLVRDEKQFLEPVVHQRFKDLLHNSERIIAVYQGRDATERSYTFIWPEDTDKLKNALGGNKIYGFVRDVSTGEIEPCTQATK